MSNRESQDKPFESSSVNQRTPPGGGTPLPMKVTTIYKPILFTYPWLSLPAPFGNGPGHGSEHGEWRTIGGRKTYHTLPQNTREYGLKVAQWCRTHDIGYISGYWSGDRNSPCIEHFDTSLGALTQQELDPLRLIYTFSLQPRFERIKQAIIERTGLITGPKYARLTDQSQQSRVPIVFWGEDANSKGAAFKQFIEELRAHFNARGVNPFFIITHHALWSNDDNVIRSVDAVYRHECAHNYDQGGHPRPINTGESVGPTKQNWANNIQQLRGKTQFSTGLPVFYISGTMPSFWRPGDVNRGKVIAQNKEQVRAMFEALRDYAQTIYVKRTGPRALEVHKLVALTSGNEWAENSTIEPCLVRPGRTAEENATYGYDYGYDFLELIRDIFRTVTKQIPEDDMADMVAPLSLSAVA